MVVSILANRREVAPFGLEGGGAGEVGKNWVERAGTRAVEALGHRGPVELDDGDVFVIHTPGGGAFGAPEGWGWPCLS